MSPGVRLSASVLAPPVDGRARGIPLGGDASVTLAELAELEWSPRDLDAPMPVLTLDASALAANLATMAAFCARVGADLAPHVKTHMSPQLFQRQLDAGAWGATVATPAQLDLLIAWGARRILLANVLADPAAIRSLATALAADRELEVLGYVDSVVGVALLDTHLAGAARPLPVLLEVGLAGGRTGVRSAAAALEVARAVRAASNVELVGVAGFEGFVGAGRPDRLEAVIGYVRDLAATARALHDAGLLDGAEPIFSAGGSAFPDLVARELGDGVLPVPTRLILRSGCSIVHDDGMYRELSPFDEREADASTEGLELRAALRLWATVLSRPEPDLVIAGFGKRDVPFDAGMPVPRAAWSPVTGEWLPGYNREVLRVDDHHAYLRVEAGDPIAVGDRVVVGVSHPCGAFDRWRLIPILDDNDRVVDGVVTWF